MGNMIRRRISSYAMLLVGGLILFAVALAFAVPMEQVEAVENPQSGSVGIEGKIPSNPPKTPATITTPSNGQSFGKTPITVGGLCTKGLLVKVFANNVFVGSADCTNGSYSLQIDLFSGRNDLVARIFDQFDQAGPDSNIVEVTFNNNQFNPFGGSLLSLTSSFAQRGANPGQTLEWPVSLTGGAGPFAVSVDWGDHKSPDLISTQFNGTIGLKHTYDTAGIYKVVVKATDKNGLSAYLQLVAVANGAVTANASGDTEEGKAPAIVRVLWLPAAFCIPLVFVTFWLGRRYELAAIRKHLERGE